MGPCSRIKESGLSSTSNHGWKLAVPSAVYIIERFDRKVADGHATRMHALDAVQLLTLSAELKYAKSGVDALIDIVKKCRPPATARLALFRWTLMNSPTAKRLATL